MEKRGLEILIDTREKTPYEFPGKITQRKKLDAGDYSIVGYEGEITVERKSISDLIGTLRSGRDRFKRELERMETYKEKYLVVEGTCTQLYQRLSQMGMLSAINSIFGSLFAFSHHYGIKVVFKADREEATKYVERKFEEFLEGRNGDVLYEDI